ncbi:unnamed protein product [Hermetia illucens]|uniref:Uncharacterized protein n=1 Tax=Hermetia illucens TaxID=343691 RepID=A0A7R8YT62_HERIL|nr:unnamed protein product [Hermetia illucens]
MQDAIISANRKGNNSPVEQCIRGNNYEKSYNLLETLLYSIFNSGNKKVPPLLQRNPITCTPKFASKQRKLKFLNLARNPPVSGTSIYSEIGHACNVHPYVSTND